METNEIHRAKQTDTLIDLFKRRPVMNTKELKMACFNAGIMNSTARVSDARKEGHLIEVTPIDGTHMSLFKYKGYSASGQLTLFKAA